MDYHSFNKRNDTYTPNNNRTELCPLPASFYKLKYQDGQLQFKAFESKYDRLIDLPSSEYSKVIQQINTFLDANKRNVFKDHGFLYKRGFLFWGSHGTGKTCLVNRVGEKVLQNKGIVLFNPNPELLEMAFKVLNDIQPDLTTMVIFEEFEQLLARYEDNILNLLDGEIQKDNVIYVATTNHFEHIPDRLKRPSRFATIVEVKSPSPETRVAYLQNKLKPEDHKAIPHWVKKTEGFTIDELKETVLSVKCLEMSLDESVERILKIKESTGRQPEESTGRQPKNGSIGLMDYEYLGLTY
ncbi:AAA family ATPase [Nostoc sp.]|uniref:AAA family ATPase n=1 Tax=Nostoc sp. TaxID=1180 RepID=UPI002FFAFA73